MYLHFFIFYCAGCIFLHENAVNFIRYPEGTPGASIQPGYPQGTLRVTLGKPKLVTDNRHKLLNRTVKGGQELTGITV